MCADLGLYLAVKIGRKDFSYWMPLDGLLEHLVSLLMRIVAKMITDFTCIVQLRHPYEVGGIYWVLGCVLTMVSLPAVSKFSEAQLQGQEIELVWTVIMYITPTTAFFFIVFFASIDRNYWKSFFSFQKGCHYTISTIRNNYQNDELKAKAIFNKSRKHWISMEEEIRSWVEANWERWEEEKPKWFDEGMRSRIPVSYIPTASARKAENDRRKSADLGNSVAVDQIVPVDSEANTE
jgi:hypothetical protein